LEHASQESTKTDEAQGTSQEEKATCTTQNATMKTQFVC